MTRSSPSGTLRYFSTFTGIGGFEVGVEKAAKELGIPTKCEGYSEIDKHCISTYEARYPNHVNYGDITKIDAAELPDFDLFGGGFPCQPFSIAGGRAGFADVRGTLFFDILRILQAKLPEKFILENVKGLITHDNGRTFRVIITALTDLGYCVEWDVLNSKDFGLAQNRERIYIVGHFGGIPRRPVFPPTRPGNPYSTIGVTAETTVARTLTAGGNTGGNHSGMTVLRTPQGDRRLTPVEWERLHGYEDNWTDVVAPTQRYKQLGNTQSPPVVEYVARRLLEPLPAP